MDKITIIQVLTGKENKNCSVFFMIGEDFYIEKFDYTQIESADSNIPLITPQSQGFNLFFANNKKFKQTLFKIMQKLDTDEKCVFPISVEIEWKNVTLHKEELQTV